MEILEAIRRWKRTFDNYFTFRRAFIFITIVFGFIFYVGPNLLRWLSQTKPNTEGMRSPNHDQFDPCQPSSISGFDLGDVAERCLRERLQPFLNDAEGFNANIQHVPLEGGEKPYVPFVGNGIFGLSIYMDSPFYIKYGRTLSLPMYWHPIVSVVGETLAVREAIVVHYVTGVSHRFQCFSSGLYISYQYYAHRTLPAIFVQDITITNPSNENLILNLQQKLHNWPTAGSQTVKLQHGIGEYDYQVVTGMVEVPNLNKDILAATVVSRKIPATVEVKARKTVTLEYLTAINYSDPIDKIDYATKKDVVESQCIEKMKRALLKARTNHYEDHVNVWEHLWSTGVSISHSKAANAINGDTINATIYYVLSQVTSPYYEEGTTKERKTELINSLFYAEGCYGGHHTLQADNLWSGLSSIKEVNTTAAYWLLTLEKQGCHNLLKAGASGVIQAIVLSVGSLRFSNQHLEFNIHPKFLHRDFLFRRVGYGNSTHVNISVVVQEDNKAVLYVALDRSDKFYYACDGGCLDPPVQLGPMKKQFPVKLTEPVTAILYVTYDRQHMEDLRHAIHVKEVAEAPAHEHHVIALHKHGDHLGGLPALFWVSISFLIIVFHLFLFKLIYNEYCGSQDKYRTRGIGVRYTVYHNI